MKYHLVTFSALIMALIACQPPAENILSATNKPLLGRWDSKILKVVNHTVNGTDSTGVLDVNPDNYEEVVGLKTASVFFNADNSYREEYIFPTGEVAYTQEGYFFVLGDTVVFAIYKPLKNQAVYRYHYRQEGDSLIFTSVMDYDGDGQEDDEFYGVSVRAN